MASAAAVAADAANSPLGNDIGEDAGNIGEVTSAIGSKEDGIVEPGDIEDDDEDDVRRTARRRGPDPAAGSGDQEGQDDGEGGIGDDDLFGDDDDGQDEPSKRQLDDEELDSGDDMDRTDRVGDDEEAQVPEQEYAPQSVVEMNLEIPRQPVPEPSDGEMYLLKVPDFLAIAPTAWDHTKFQPPTTDHHSKKPPSSGFSAYNSALTTVRWRHSPTDPSKLQSNARVLRWSDGSTTLQMASQPTVQYEIDGNALAPPQRNPVRPTPVSVSATQGKGGRQGDGSIAGEKYDATKDAFTYLVVPSISSGMLRVSHKITGGLSIRQSDNVTDDAIEKLQAALAKASNATKVQGVGDLKLIEENPEARRLQAEEAMRQKAKAQKKAEAAIQREADRNNRALGRAGLSSSRYGGGLDSGFLEDEDEMGASRPKKAGGASRRARQRRNSIYSDDEDFGRKKFTSREDEYDEEDDFLAASDEEEEVDDDEDPDDGIVEEPRARERTPKRERPVADDDDADAEGEVDEEVVPAARKRQRVIVDDDEEE